jgi:Zn-dependent protease with chaperone function
MTKLFFILFIFLLVSCAHGNKYIPHASQQDKERTAIIIENYKKSFNCLKIREDGETSRLRLNKSTQVNAWVADDNDVFITEGLIQQGIDVVNFTVTHELSHVKLKHVRNKKIVSYTTTGIMVAAGFVVPGIGLLNHVVNPAVTNNFSKSQEYDADKLASETLIKCFNMPLEIQTEILQNLRSSMKEGGGFWSNHPAWEDRIKNIQETH